MQIPIGIECLKEMNKLKQTIIEKEIRINALLLYSERCGEFYRYVKQKHPYAMDSGWKEIENGEVERYTRAYRENIENLHQELEKLKNKSQAFHI